MRGSLWLLFAGAVSSLVACTSPSPMDDVSIVDAADATSPSMDGTSRDQGVCEDNDNDGHPSAACGGDDCDDNNPRRNPGVREVCDNLGVDEDCDPCTVAEVSVSGRGGDGDRDEDGFFNQNCFNTIAMGQAAPVCSTTTLDAGVGDAASRSFDPVVVTATAVRGTDCADDPAAGGASRSPGAAEICNALDDDCDGEPDNGVGFFCYEDRDRDGYAAMGATALPMRQCSMCPAGSTAREPVGSNIDCDDTAPSGANRGGADVHPTASDLCNTIDDDCDPTTLNGSDDLRIDAVCSMTGGVGRCATGRNTCDLGGGLRCTAASPVLEMCNGEDDDCDRSTDESLCVDSTIDPMGRQNVPTGYGTCIAGNRCSIGVCVAGRGNCDRDSANGCETNLLASADNCGGCGVRCFGQPCTNGRCARSPVAVRIVAGAAHACALLSDRTVACWGDNSAGQLGDGTNTSHSNPTLVLGLTDVALLAAGLTHTCAIKTTREVVCWGGNSSGQLGDGTTISRRGPTPVAMLSNVTAITAAGRHTCALLATRQVMCWGANGFGQLGLGTTTATQSAPALVSGLGDAIEITAGGRGELGTLSESHTCARRNTGAIVCWGSNGSGQLGDGTITNRSAPTTVADVSSVVELSAGGRHTCARRVNGTIACWGANEFGQLGDGATSANRLRPVTVVGVLTSASVVAGGDNTCSVLTDGAVRCWGNNNTNVLGVFGLSFSALPLPVSVAPVAELVVGDGLRIPPSAGSVTSVFACARRTDGSVQCWGGNERGQLGDGTLASRPSVESTALSANVAEVSAGGGFSCARRAWGTLACWGNNDVGQLGIGAVSSSRPVSPLALPTDAVEVDAGRGHACARLASGTVMCWGRNVEGQIGDGTNVTRPAPILVPALTNVVEIAVGGAHTCARQGNGAVQCWGMGTSGQLGNSATSNRAMPTPVTGLTDALALSAGESHTCALRAAGQVVCWGSNTNGQLGDGTVTNRSAPTAVSGLTDATELSASSTHTCGRRATGQVLCWGNNSAGQLGDGTMTARLVPTMVPGMMDAVEIGTGVVFSCARRATGQVLCWGADNFGQLGDGSTVSSGRPPVSVRDANAEVTDALSLSVGDDHACVRRASGSVDCWGNNGGGQLGSGSMSASPVARSVSGL